MDSAVALPTVLVTGASGAIGSAVVDAFLARGFAVAGIDVVAPARDRSAIYTHIEADVLQLDQLVEAAEMVGGDLCHIIGVAGGALPEETERSEVEELDVELFRRSLELNLVSQYAVIQAFLPVLCASQGRARDLQHPSITVISSVNALIGMDMPAYSAAKGGLIAMVRTLARLLGPRGIRVNAVAPGTVPTPRTERIWSHDAGHFERLRLQSPIGRLATPADVASAVCSLAVDLVAVTAQTLVVDAGQTAVWKY